MATTALRQDPCDVAADVAGGGTGVSIQAVGFQVGARARRQLRCIARRGRGVYRDAAGADDLAVELRALAARALRTYRPVGRSIRGGATEAAPAPIASGRYVDRIGADDDRWYAVRLATSQQLAVAAVVSHACPFPRGLAEMIGTALELDLFRPDSELPEASSGVANLFVGDESSESDGLRTMPIGHRGDPAFEPSPPGRYLLRVRLSDNGSGGLGDVLGGDTLALQVQANITGAGRPPPSVAAPAAPARRSGGHSIGLLVAVSVACLLAGALLSLFAARRRRSS